MDRLGGRHAIVTGGGSGIGRASALRFAAEGAAVLVVGRTAANIDETVALIVSAGGRASAFVADVEVEDQVAAMATHARTLFGTIEILFANAGTTDKNVPFFQQTVAQWEQVFRGNAISAFLSIKHVAPAMIEQRRGSIMLMSSAGSLRANAGTIAYAASKAAVNALAMGAANAFAGTGVRVNAIAAGLVETKLTRATFEQARAAGVEDKIGRITPLQRAGRLEELAATAAFLASDDSGFIDGQIIGVDGGLSSTHPFGRVAL